MNTCDEIFERAASIEDVAKSESEYLPDWYDKETFIKGFQEGAEYMESKIPLIIKKYLETAYISKEQGYMNVNEWFNNL